MSNSKRPEFIGGRNIAMKVPPHQFDATVRFYGEVLGLKPIENHPSEVGFEFGSNRLWIDRVPSVSQAEVWLEIVTNDPSAAAKILENENVVRCDEIEALPDGFEAFWISNPASIIHLVCNDEETS